MLEDLPKKAIANINYEYEAAAVIGIGYRLLDIQRAEKELEKFKKLVLERKDISVLMPGDKRLTSYSYLTILE